jgi:LCP family protein required for cell wall assembly
VRTTLKRGAGRGEPDGQAPEVAGSASGSPPRPPLTAVNRYGGGRRGLRLAGKILLWLIIVLLVAGGSLGGGIWLYLDRSAAAIRPSSNDTKITENSGEVNDAPPPDQPATALVIGYDSRTGPQHDVGRSDTIMLVRADPDNHTISLLSFPRDLVVQHPGCPRHPEPWTDRINTAYSLCGSLGVLRTVKQLTGLPVNYVITVNFRGFKELVNRLGGVYLDVDHRYYNPTGGDYATINLQPGYQKLNGQQALDFARFRHTDSDLVRNVRQQLFVKALKQAIQARFSITRLPGIIGVVTHTVEVVRGGSTQVDAPLLLSYARFLYGLPSGAFYQAKIENLTGGNELYASPESIQAAVRSFLHPDTNAAAKATAAARGHKPPATGGLEPKDTTIEVLNGNGVEGAASTAATELSQLGYRADPNGNAVDGNGNPKWDYFDTVVQYDPDVPGAADAALQVAKLFDGNADQAPPGVQLTTTLRVIVGETFHGTIASAPSDSTPEHQPPTTVRAFDSVLPYLREARPKVRFPLLVPTMVDRSSSLDTYGVPVRVYRVEHEDAVKIVYRLSTAVGGYWGVEETGWTDAPILDGPSREITIGGRTLKLYFTGSKLHMVAFVQNGAAYWVTNTLLDDLSNETMISIARGLQPLSALRGG